MSTIVLILFPICILSTSLSLFADEKKEVEVATFAGGCFWCMQKALDEQPGVLSTTVGYTGGETENPSYNEVSSGGGLAMPKRLKSNLTQKSSPMISYSRFFG